MTTAEEPDTARAQLLRKIDAIDESALAYQIGQEESYQDVINTIRLDLEAAGIYLGDVAGAGSHSIIFQLCDGSGKVAEKSVVRMGVLDYPEQSATILKPIACGIYPIPNEDRQPKEFQVRIMPSLPDPEEDPYGHRSTGKVPETEEPHVARDIQRVLRIMLDEGKRISEHLQDHSIDSGSFAYIRKADDKGFERYPHNAPKAFADYPVYLVRDLNSFLENGHGELDTMRRAYDSRAETDSTASGEGNFLPTHIESGLEKRGIPSPLKLDALSEPERRFITNHLDKVQTRLLKDAANELKGKGPQEDGMQGITLSVLADKGFVPYDSKEFQRGTR